MDHSLGFQFRLHHRGEFLNFFQGGEFLRLKACTLFRVKSPNGYPRLGITIKAKCSSIERSRVKRVIREFFRRHKQELGSYDYNVVISGRNKLDYTYANGLRKNLEEKFFKEICHFKTTY